MGKCHNSLRFLPCGDSAVTVEFSKEINEKTNRKIRYIAEATERMHLKGIRECVPTFCSLTIYFNPLVISKEKIKKKILKLSDGYTEDKNEKKRIFYIPVCYEDEFAPDIADICSHNGLNKDEIINIHTAPEYLINMLGFLPGFPYLGGMDERIATPRLDTPRTVIPEGAVGIGGNQTGIYPLASPGGWRLIGRTPVKVYDSRRNEPILYKAGDYIKFYPITRAEFDTYDTSTMLKVKEEY